MAFRRATKLELFRAQQLLMYVNKRYMLLFNVIVQCLATMNAIIISRHCNYKTSWKHIKANA